MFSIAFYILQSFALSPEFLLVHVQLRLVLVDKQSFIKENKTCTNDSLSLNIPLPLLNNVD